MWDADGRRYIDWVCGYGPVVLGHGDHRVAHAVFDQVLHGTLFPGRSSVADALAERLLAHYPAAESCVFLKTGSEAVSAAIRFARAYTGRRDVLRVGFHGWHDGLVDAKLGWHNWDNARTHAAEPPGTLPHSAIGIEVGHGYSFERLEHRLRDPGLPALAAIVVDPIQLTDPGSDLPRLRHACDDTATLLVLDETKTAFRVSLGGVQQLYDVQADLTVAGKALANGLPLSTVLGPNDVVRPKATRVKGTFSSELGALAAARATLDALESDDVCAHLASIGRSLIAGINDALRDHAVSELVTAVPYRWDAMPHLHAATSDPAAQRARSILVDTAHDNGVLLLDGHNSFVSAAHAPSDVYRTCEALEAAAKALKASFYDT